jgi:hypothetical protein
MGMGISLAPSVDLDETAALLRGMETDIPHLPGSSVMNQISESVRLYVLWVRKHEGNLKGKFYDPAVRNHLRTQEYFAIRAGTTEPIELINSEIARQTEWFGQLASKVEHLRARLQAAPGRPTVVDTHVLLHYQPPAQVNWAQVTKSPQVRLILPLRVIEELDEKKWSAGRETLRTRARSILSDLWALLAATDGDDPVTLRDNTTIEVPIDDGPRQRTTDADEEILDICVDLKNLRQNVLLVTGDCGMSLRAKALQIPVEKMPDKYLRESTG